MTICQKINSNFIKLDQLLKLSGLAQTGGQAKLAIKNQEVFVNDVVCCACGKKIVSGDIVKYKNHLIEVLTDV